MSRTRDTLAPGLMIVHGNRPESLRDLVVEWMRAHPLAPLETETLLVQSNGIAQWLRLGLAAEPAHGGCGIAMALDFLLPSSFLWRAYRAVLGEAAVPEVSPFDKPRLIWRLMRLLPALIERPAFASLRRFLAADEDLRKRYQLAERLADLFDQYQVYRADWLMAWGAGEDVLIRPRGAREPLAADRLWQAELWRALLTDIEAGGEARDSGRWAVHRRFMIEAGRLDRMERPPALPRRIVVFGISALPRQALEALWALARWSQVLMCVHNPCRHHWADIVADRDLLRAREARQARRPGQPDGLDEDALHQHAHPLLAAWGRQGRDFIGLLDEHDSGDARARYRRDIEAIGARIDLFEEHARAEPRLLHQMQDDILDLAPLGETRERWPAVDVAGDDSIRFHLAHSRQREVEILHDQLLAAFDADPGLRPRDVIVMVPDIENYAAHIQAVFGRHASDDPCRIPFSVADRGPRAQSAVPGALRILLDLPRSRFAVSEMLGLLDVPALRARFGLEEGDLPLLHRWIREARIRWGLHAEQRASLGLPAEDGHTWLFGLRRLLLGYAVGESDGRGEAWVGIEPCAQVGGLDAERLGPLVCLIERLEHHWRTLREPAPPACWHARLGALCEDFFAPQEMGDVALLGRLRDALDEWLNTCREAALEEAMPLSVVGEHWLATLEDGGLTQRFFAGSVTFATLMPMRAIPFRLVCLLGMNDGDYPRRQAPADFDLMAGDYRPGDRSRREDDRYLFLEALLSARDRLYISWIGRRISDNSPRPPSVLVAQLRDHLARGWVSTDPGRPLLDALTVVHPLQPFNPAYFPLDQAGSLFTYAHEWRLDASAGSRMGEGAPRLAAPEGELTLDFDALAAFLRDPVRAFFQQRLGVYFRDENDENEDHEPFVLDALENWRLQAELIHVQLTALRRNEAPSRALEQALRRLSGRGELAVGAFGEHMADTLRAPMDDLMVRYTDALGRWPSRIEAPRLTRLKFALDGASLTLSGRLDALHAGAQGRARLVLDSGSLIRERKYRFDKLLAHWVQHLVLPLEAALDDGETSWTTEIHSKAGSVSFQPLTREAAQAVLSDLLTVWREGMCRPLPYTAPLGDACLHASEEARYDAMRKAYEGGYRQSGEVDRNPYLRRAYPEFDALWCAGESAQWAERLLGPLRELVKAIELKS